MGISLREIFTPMVSHVLLLVRGPNQRQQSFAELRSDMDRLLAEQAQLVKRHDIPPQDYDTARFAVVAWVDEQVLQFTHQANRELSQQWKRSPLQVQLFNTANAGEEFFDRLTHLEPAQKEIREIYHLCLCLGFRGRYYDDNQEYKRVELRREAGQHLLNPIPELLELEKRRERLTPQPYDVQAPPPRPPRRSYAWLWYGLALAAIAAAALYIVWPPAQRARTAIVAELTERLKKFTCCRIVVADFASDTGTVRLEGTVDSEEQRQQVSQAVKGVPEVKDVQDSFTIIPRPFCEVIELLRPLQARGQQAGMNLSVHPQKGCDAVYKRGESLVFNVAAAKPLRYVYVDYYVADRKAVAHLFPTAKQHDDSSKATTLTLGDASSETQWDVEPPFGMELVTVMTSPQPLFTTLRPPVDQDASYIDELHKKLPTDGTSTEVSAAYCFIRTEDR